VSHALYYEHNACSLDAELSARMKFFFWGKTGGLMGAAGFIERGTKAQG
jgi:hypothetical protein